MAPAAVLPVMRTSSRWTVPPRLNSPPPNANPGLAGSAGSNPRASVASPPATVSPDTVTSGDVATWARVGVVRRVGGQGGGQDGEHAGRAAAADGHPVRPGAADGQVVGDVDLAGEGDGAVEAAGEADGVGPGVGVGVGDGLPQRPPGPPSARVLTTNVLGTVRSSSGRTPSRTGMESLLRGKSAVTERGRTPTGRTGLAGARRQRVVTTFGRESRDAGPGGAGACDCGSGAANPVASGAAADGGYGNTAGSRRPENKSRNSAGRRPGWAAGRPAVTASGPRPTRPSAWSRRTGRPGRRTGPARCRRRSRSRPSRTRCSCPPRRP